jgi:hypothetical protein
MEGIPTCASLPIQAQTIVRLYENCRAESLIRDCCPGQQGENRSQNLKAFNWLNLLSHGDSEKSGRGLVCFQRGPIAKQTVCGSWSELPEPESLGLPLSTHVNLAGYWTSQSLHFVICKMEMAIISTWMNQERIKQDTTCKMAETVPGTQGYQVLSGYKTLLLLSRRQKARGRRSAWGIWKLPLGAGRWEGQLSGSLGSMLCLKIRFPWGHQVRSDWDRRDGLRNERRQARALSLSRDR